MPLYGSWSEVCDAQRFYYRVSFDGRGWFEWGVWVIRLLRVGVAASLVFGVAARDSAAG